jgi:hypothetical protein
MGGEIEAVSCPQIQHMNVFQAAGLPIEIVRRQTLWGHLALFLRDTFLPDAAPV